MAINTVGINTQPVNAATPPLAGARGRASMRIRVAASGVTGGGFLATFPITYKFTGAFGFNTLQGHIILPPITTTIRMGASASVTMPRLSVRSRLQSGGVGSIAITLPSPRVTIRTGMSGVIAAPPPRVIAKLGNGTLGAVAVHIRLGITAVGTSENRGVVSGRIRIRLSAKLLTGNFATATPRLSLTFLGLGKTLVNGVVNANIRLSVSSRMMSQNIYVLSGRLGLSTWGSGTSESGTSIIGIAVNMSNGAVTKYEDVAYNSVQFIHGKPYAATSTGIFRVDGDMDGTAAIVAEAISGIDDFESNHMKRISDAWLGVRSPGELEVVTITDENTERRYRLSLIRDGLNEKRVKLSRGVKSKYWQLGIRNVNGSDFQLESITTEPEVLTRRVR